MSFDDPHRPEFASWKSYRSFERKVLRSTRFVWDKEIQAFLDTVVATIKDRDYILAPNRILYRAQLGAEREPADFGSETETYQEVYPYRHERMKPLPGRAFEGRANPAGIPVLYTASTLGTAISEVRPWIGSEVSVARCRPVRNLKVLNLSVNHGGKPFAGVSFDHLMSGTEPSASERCTAVWTEIDNAFSIPASRSGDSSDYAPTQILAELFRSVGYDGIAYKSNFDGNHGFNIVLFSLDYVNIVDCDVYEVKNIAVNFEKISSRDDENLNSDIGNLNSEVRDIENNFTFVDFHDFFKSAFIIGDFINDSVDYKRDNRGEAYIEYSKYISAITFLNHIVNGFSFDISDISNLIKNDSRLNSEEKRYLFEYISVCLKSEPVDFLFRQRLKALSDDRKSLLYNELIRFICFAEENSKVKIIDTSKCYKFFPDLEQYKPSPDIKNCTGCAQNFNNETRDIDQFYAGSSRIEYLRHKLFGRNTSIFDQENAAKVDEIVGRLPNRQKVLNLQYDDADISSDSRQSTDGRKERPAALDAARIAAIRDDTARVSTVLGEIFSVDDDANGWPLPDSALSSLLSGLDPKHASFVERIIQRTHLTEEEFEQIAKAHGLMPSGALEVINEWSFGKFERALLDEYDGYDISQDISDALRAEILKRD